MALIAIRVTPRSAKPGIGGWRQGAHEREELEVRVADAPADGAANEAVVKLLAKASAFPRDRLRSLAAKAAATKEFGCR